MGPLLVSSGDLRLGDMSAELVTLQWGRCW